MLAQPRPPSELVTKPGSDHRPVVPGPAGIEADRRDLAAEAQGWRSHATALAGWSHRHLVNVRCAHGQYRPLDRREVDPRSGRVASAFTANEYVSLSVLEGHFTGEDVGHLIGLHALGDAADGIGIVCRWVALDFDNHRLKPESPDLAAPNLAMALACRSKAAALGLTTLLLDSEGRGGLHLVIPFQWPAPATTARRLVKWLAADFATFGLPAIPDLFPSSDRPGRQGLGSWLRLSGRHHTFDHWTRVWDEPRGWLADAAAAFSLPYRAVLGGTNYAAQLIGPTGSHKSCVAALIQQHFGARLDYRDGLGVGWNSTANALEGLLNLAKDVVLVVDDFVPNDGGGVAQERAQRDGARLLRGQGNRQGRHRMRRDASLAGAKPPRGTLVTTGEDRVRSRSAHGRTLPICFNALVSGKVLGTIDRKVLSVCQVDADAGLFAASLAAFVVWLAPRLEEERASLAARARTDHRPRVEAGDTTTPRSRRTRSWAAGGSPVDDPVAQICRQPQNAHAPCYEPRVRRHTSGFDYLADPTAGTRVQGPAAVPRNQLGGWLDLVGLHDHAHLLLAPQAGQPEHGDGSS